METLAWDYCSWEEEEKEDEEECTMNDISSC
jgi:hypothetical protein